MFNYFNIIALRVRSPRVLIINLRFLSLNDGQFKLGGFLCLVVPKSLLKMAQAEGELFCYSLSTTAPLTSRLLCPPLQVATFDYLFQIRNP